MEKGGGINEVVFCRNSLRDWPQIGHDTVIDLDKL